jgi:hypothetical protein
MGTKRKDITGQRHGRLTVISPLRVHPTTNNWIWLCQCDCGKTTEVAGRMLRGDAGTRSCGCLSVEANRRRDQHKPSKNRLHGEGGGPFTPKTPEFVSWLSMRQRCRDENHSAYRLYGARGIRVCEQWDASYAQFLADMGRRPKGHTLDRIDCNGNYEPSNCRWADWKTQGNNRGVVRHVSLGGELLPVTEAAARAGVPEKTVHNWLRKTGEGGAIDTLLAKHRPIQRGHASLKVRDSL